MAQAIRLARATVAQDLCQRRADLAAARQNRDAELGQQAAQLSHMGVRLATARE